MTRKSILPADAVDADAECSALRHGIARIDRKIQQRELELIWIDLDEGHLLRGLHLHRDIGPDISGDQVAHSADQLSQVYRSEEHTSELQSLMRISYAVFCLKKKNTQQSIQTYHEQQT